MQIVLDLLLGVDLTAHFQYVVDHYQNYSKAKCAVKHSTARADVDDQARTLSVVQHFLLHINHHVSCRV